MNLSNRDVTSIFQTLEKVLQLNNTMDAIK
jgi:hypothetical protein